MNYSTVTYREIEKLFFNYICGCDDRRGISQDNGAYTADIFSYECQKSID